MPSTLVFDDLTLDCRSRAGDTTWLRVRPPNLAIDVGRGTPRLAGVERVFLTHGHLDHALGVPFLLSMRGAGRGRPLEIYCPAAIEPATRRFVEAAEELDGRSYEYRLEGLEAGDRVEVGREHAVEAFATDHVVPGLGYHLLRSRRRLRADLEGADREHLDAIRRHGESLDETWEECTLSCTGDTAASVFEKHPELFLSRVLVVECTFLQRGHGERARRFGHIHLDDLVELRERFENSALVLYHLSRRHGAHELRRAARERLEPLPAEVHVVG